MRRAVLALQEPRVGIEAFAAVATHHLRERAVLGRIQLLIRQESAAQRVAEDRVQRVAQDRSTNTGVPSRPLSRSAQ